MIKQILSGYLGVARAILRIVALLAVCVGIGFLIVYPLWSLADSDPALYSIIFACVAGILIAYLIGSAGYRAWKKDARRFVIAIASRATLVVGFLAAILLVLAMQRLIAGIVLLVTLAAYGFLAFGLAQTPHRQAR